MVEFKKNMCYGFKMFQVTVSEFQCSPAGDMDYACFTKRADGEKVDISIENDLLTRWLLDELKRKAEGLNVASELGLKIIALQEENEKIKAHLTASEFHRAKAEIENERLKPLAEIGALVQRLPELIPPDWSLGSLGFEKTGDFTVFIEHEESRRYLSSDTYREDGKPESALETLRAAFGTVRK